MAVARADAGGGTSHPPGAEAAAAGGAGGSTAPGQLGTTQELLWVKLSQNYTFDEAASDRRGAGLFGRGVGGPHAAAHGAGSPWRGNFDVYGQGFGYQNLSLAWRVTDRSSLQADWRSTRDSTQDFLDLGGKVPLGGVEIQAAAATISPRKRSSRTGSTSSTPRSAGT